MAYNWSNKVLKGDELYYYTQKLRDKFRQIEATAASDKEELQQAIDAVREDLDNLKLEINVTGGAQYSEYYYGGDVYETYEEAVAAAEEAGGDTSEVTHSTEVVKLFDKNGNELEPAQKYMYLVPADSGDPATSTDLPNSYNEYIWIEESGYELIGSTDIDLIELSNNDVDAIWLSVFPE